MDKKKLVISIGIILAGGAVIYIAYTHAQSANAQAAADQGGALPTLLYTTGSGGGATLPVQSSSLDTGANAAPAQDTGLAAIVAALQGTIAQIEASTNVAYNATASDLFKTLPVSLSVANIQGITASQEQTASGKTTLQANVVYNPLPVPPAPAPAPKIDLAAALLQGESAFQIAHISNYGVPVPNSVAIFNDINSYTQRIIDQQAKAA